MLGYKMTEVLLSDIEDINGKDLIDSRLYTLQNGYDSFDKVLNSNSDPITLDKSKKPYTILDGRHRIFLARQKGYKKVNVRFG